MNAHVSIPDTAALQELHAKLADLEVRAFAVLSGFPACRERADLAAAVEGIATSKNRIVDTLRKQRKADAWRAKIF